MKKQNSGHVVNISGASVDQPSSAERALLAVLSKSTMPAASKALAMEYAANKAARRQGKADLNAR